jgi:hypothetical protein
MWHAPLDPHWKGAVNYVTNWHRVQPDIGWGIHLGLSGILGFDNDVHKGGEDSRLQLIREGYFRELPCHVRTGSGGTHTYLRAPSHVHATRGWIGANGESRCHQSPLPGLDLKCGQSYMVLPFSPHKSGGSYTGSIPEDVPECPPEYEAYWNSFPCFTPRPARVISEYVPSAAAGCPANATSYDRCWAYVQTMEGPTHDGSHSRKACKVARLAYIDFALDADQAREILVRWDSVSSEPMTAKEVDRIMNFAQRGGGERGWRNHEGGRGWSKEEMEILACLPAYILAMKMRKADKEEKWDDSLKEANEKIEKCPNDHCEDGEAQMESAHSMSCEDAQDEIGAFRCAHWRTVSFASLRGIRRWVQRFPCQCLRCEGCFDGKKKEYKDTIKMHLGRWWVEHGRDAAPPLFVAYVLVKDWVKVSAKLRHRFASFFRLAPFANGFDRGHSYLVVATEQVPGPSWRAASAADAQAELFSAIDGFASNLRCRVWHSSKDWVLWDDSEPREPEWRRLGKIRTKWHDVMEITEFFDPDYRITGGGSARWPAHGVQITLKAGDEDRWEASISEGVCIPDRISFKKRGQEESDEWSPPPDQVFADAG